MQIAPKLILAPMEGVTDVVMRDLITSLGGVDLCVSEFIRIAQHIPPKKVIIKAIPEAMRGWKTPSGTPIFPQILGGNPERMAGTAQKLIEWGAPGVDLNFGCPAKCVNRNDGGATLLKDPQRLKSIIQAVRQAIPNHPLTVKIRLGWENPHDVFLIAECIDTLNVQWLTIHARTKMDGYKPPAHWNFLRDVKQKIKTPIIANGDIFSVEDFKRCSDLTGCESFMIGRGILQNPFLISALKNIPPTTTAIGALKRFIDLSIQYYGITKVGPGRIKQFLRYLSLGDAGLQHLFTKIKSCQTLEEIINRLPNHK